MKLTFEGNTAFQKKLKDLPKEVEEEFALEIEATLNDIRNQSLLLAPTDIAGGQGIRSTGYSDFNRANLEGEVGYRTKYAAYVEFGTGAFVDIPAGLEDYAMQFFVNGKGRIPAKAFLFPAFFRETKELEKRMAKILEETWKK